jgi:hypothetical protein
MLRGVKEFEGYAIRATDGDIGHVHDVFFDADQWTLRYFVVDTGPWLLGRRVLIAPVALKTPDWNARVLPVELTKEQVKDSPDVDTDMPVSRQQQIAYHDYYRWPYYWGGGGFLGTGAGVGVAPEAFLWGKDGPDIRETGREELASEGDPDLHSARAVMGYRIAASDGDFGHVDDFLIEDGSWVIRYLVIDTGGLLKAGKKALVAPPWIEYVSWRDSKVSVDLPRAKIETAPDFDPAHPPTRDYEQELHRHYGLPDYWTVEAGGRR